MDELASYLPFIQPSGGGITVSGGESLLQMPFLIELFKECKKKEIHTTIDSSGGSFNAESETYMKNLDELLGYTDLILLDLKHINRKKHIKLTGMPNDHIIDFAQLLSERDIPVWIRHVLIPTITDNDEDLIKLREFIGTLKNVERVEILPYHKLGVYKWKALGLEYPLEGIETPSDDRVESAFKNLTTHYKKRKVTVI